MLAGLDVPFPFPPDYSTTIVPQLQDRVRRAVPADADAARPEVGRRGGKPERRRSSDVRPRRSALAGTAATSCSRRASARGEGTRTNVDTVYQIDADPALSAEEIALNASILRIDLDPQARREQGLAGVPAIAGTFRMPVLSMHTLGDLFVPFSMEQIYARRAAENGVGDRLVTRAIRDINHCGFTTVEMERGFADLVNWVSQWREAGRRRHPDARDRGQPELRLQLHRGSARVRRRRARREVEQVVRSSGRQVSENFLTT